MTYQLISIILGQARLIPGIDQGAMASMTPEQVRAAYNGTGPERWPEAIRAMLDDLTAEFALAVCIHDCDFEQSDGSDAQLQVVTDRFQHNTRAIYRYTWPWFTLEIFRRAYRLRRARAAAVMTALNLGVTPVFSRQAWREAAARNHKE